MDEREGEFSERDWSKHTHDCVCAATIAMGCSLIIDHRMLAPQSHMRGPIDAMAAAVRMGRYASVQSMGSDTNAESECIEALL